MGQAQTIIAAWVVVGVISVSCAVACARLSCEVWRLRRAAAYRVSTIIISRTSLVDLESANRVGGGEVCFVAVDKPPLVAGQEACFVCCESAAVNVVGGCGHGGMCDACFTRVWAYPHAKCPICRGGTQPGRVGGLTSP